MIARGGLIIDRAQTRADRIKMQRAARDAVWKAEDLVRAAIEFFGVGSEHHRVARRSLDNARRAFDRALEEP